MAKRWTKGMREGLRRVLVPNWSEVAGRLSESLGTHITPGSARKQWFRMQRQEGKKLLSELRAVERDYEAATAGLTADMCKQKEEDGK